MKLKDKVAIITGAGRGIGREIALLFAKEGANVVINAAHLESAQRVANEVSLIGSRALAIQGDVSVNSDVEKMVKLTLNEFGKIDILVNNAGINLLKPILDLTEEEWDRIIDVNLKGVFLCLKEVGRIMIRQGYGNIINISSITGIGARPDRAAYAASKAGVIMLTKCAAVEWAKYGIRVNAIAPGTIMTERIKSIIAQGVYTEEMLKKRIPLGRIGETIDVAKVALFLASDDSSYITGEVIVVDGGWLAYSYL
ncbi:MAG: glucose 1-dehydrogenase [Nitrososphaerota archaeon]|nr:glucose 1-dehydrogenase [Nitrososphaerota archaeon]